MLSLFCRRAKKPGLGVLRKSYSKGKYQAYNQMWNFGIRFGIVSIAAGGAALVYYAPKHRSKIAGEVAEITSETLNDMVLQQSTKELAMKVTHHLLHDEKTKEALVELIRDVIRQPQTYEALRDLIIWLLKQEWLIKETAGIAAWSTHYVRTPTLPCPLLPAYF
uniref:Uncharacterized protein n=1 Tax=Lotharella globosa TaxID=91324 RepID=A0A7S3ZCS6_9EUKA